MLAYPANVIRDGQSFVVTFPDIPNTHTNGSTREDALAHAPDALHAGLSMLMEKGVDIPVPRRPGSRHVMVSLPSIISSAKVELYQAVRAAGIRKTDLARKMGIHKQQVERLMDPDHGSRIEQIELAFAVLQKRLVVSIRNAA